ncbi:MAG: ABC transporter ATP-binding protein [Dysgonamonadaceae bacterium]|jgi:NitT/TauT family transport system ATP-binding protein|nr:ABC transporter ATP-binding protein [Dysgonamonadaceae bacterium]
MAFLSIQHLTVGYEKTEAIRRLNFSVEKGNICCLIGPSGCGKSTLLKTICGILQPQEGKILLENATIDPTKQTIGYIPQHFGLLDWLTVKDNLFLGKKIRKIPSSPDDEQIIHQLEIGQLLNRYPKELSGGQQQRVALARAWMLQPQLLLMDEPFSSLDSFTADRSIDLFLQLWEKQKITTLFVTHNLREAVRIGQSIVLLSEQPAEALEVIPKKDFQRLC